MYNNKKPEAGWWWVVVILTVFSRNATSANVHGIITRWGWRRYMARKDGRIGAEGRMLIKPFPFELTHAMYVVLNRPHSGGGYFIFQEAFIGVFKEYRNYLRLNFAPVSCVCR